MCRKLEFHLGSWYSNRRYSYSYANEMEQPTTLIDIYQATNRYLAYWYMLNGCGKLINISHYLIQDGFVLHKVRISMFGVEITKICHSIHKFLQNLDIQVLQSLFKNTFISLPKVSWYIWQNISSVIA